MDKIKKDIKKYKKISNHVIIFSTIALISWFAIVGLIELGSQNELLSLALRLPIIIASFGIGAGLGLKTGDRLGFIVVTAFTGLLLSYVFSTPLESYIGFVNIFVNRSIY